MQAQRDERSIGQLFADLARETSTLVRQEVTLAKVEMTDKAARVGKDVGFLAAGGAVLYAGFLALLGAVILGLIAVGLAAWLSAAIVGVVVALIGYLLVQRGLSALKREDLAPRQTIESLREDAEIIKEHAK